MPVLLFAMRVTVVMALSRNFPDDSCGTATIYIGSSFLKLSSGDRTDSLLRLRSVDVRRAGNSRVSPTDGIVNRSLADGVRAEQRGARYGILLYVPA